MAATNATPKTISPVIARLFYAAFILFSVYYAFKADWFNAASNMGIALIFDPFEGTWAQRKKWQQAWLIVHVLILLVLFVTGFWN